MSNDNNIVPWQMIEGQRITYTPGTISRPIIGQVPRKSTGLNAYWLRAGIDICEPPSYHRFVNCMPLEVSSTGFRGCQGLFNPCWTDNWEITPASRTWTLSPGREFGHNVDLTTLTPQTPRRRRSLRPTPNTLHTPHTPRTPRAASYTHTYAGDRNDSWETGLSALPRLSKFILLAAFLA
jgi:hypothetical protein